ncbi:hypothetical protein [Agrococcus carbonis]|uniref:Uncharacterized protein n=1 Tax=Agrococcus carbonis TaxID=684552 RepID=A0A1H1LNY7_9MICO|nr:hypothetical protein [Agrococcus carbonis]SDR76246.1 hypothetical protein SAMN04489719_0691 [Agrococcus carbonis]
MTTQQQIDAPTAKPPRDPQAFTRGDQLAWKIVAYVLSGVAVAGTAAALIVFVVLAT